MLLTHSRFPLPAAWLAPAPSAAPSWRRQEQTLVLDLMVPGLSPSELTLQQEGRHVELALGDRSAVRTVLPAVADPLSLSATLSRGVLRLSLDLLPSSVPRTIAVQEIAEPQPVA